MAVPDEAEAGGCSRIRWDDLLTGLSELAAIMRRRLRPGLDLPGPVFRQAI